MRQSVAPAPLLTSPGDTRGKPQRNDQRATIGEGSMDLAERLDRLGTETAFAVSGAAAEWAGRGNRVYPLHLGDIKLPTPANIVTVMNEAIAEGKTGYCAAAGITPLREALAANIGADRGI